MIVVVLVGLVMGVIISGLRLMRLRGDFLVRVVQHRELEALCEDLKDNASSALKHDVDTIAALEKDQGSRASGEPADPFESLALEQAKADQPHWRQQIAQMTQEIAYHAAMARKYERAARYPWRPVDPDPPLPNELRTADY
jgi:hypothetical protein